MKKRIKLADRILPRYSKGEEVMNMVTHTVGGGLGILVLLLCMAKAGFHGRWPALLSAIIYGASMIALYTISSVYHGLHPNTGKKVLQVLDHCTIYVLIAGTYTPIAVCTFIPGHPVLGFGLLILEWGLGALAITLTAIDLKKYNVFSMICYIGMGWAILPFLKLTRELLTPPGFILLLSGGIAYTIGAILYGIGSKVRWMHSVFHIFVVLGSILQFLSIYLYVLP